MDIVTNEKQIREKALLKRRGLLTTKQTKEYAESLDLALEVMIESNRVGCFCKEADAIIRKAVMEPDEFFDCCLAEASAKFKDHVNDVMVGKGGKFFKEYVNGLIVETAIGIGAGALMEAYQNEN